MIDATGRTRDTSVPCTIGAVEYAVILGIAVAEGTTAFSTTETFTLTAHPNGAPENQQFLTYQWYKNGVPIFGATSSTYTASQSEASAKYYCVVAGLQTPTLTITTTHDTTQPQPFDVYETKVSVRTAAIKKMNVKVAGKTQPATIHYRAPVAQSHTLIMAYDRGWTGDYAKKGYGRMWTSGLKAAFTLGGESLTVSGRKTDAHPSPIGAKGQNIPVKFECYSTADSTTPRLRFTGLATIDWRNERLSSSTGIVYAENVYPLPLRGAEWVDQGSLNGEEPLEGIYYPQPCFEEGTRELKPAHFHGTYTTRYNAAVSKNASDTRASMEKAVNDRVPKR